jgi:hypothetical protein
MAAFTNLALSASSLGTNYLNDIFIIPRGQYEQLGTLMLTVSAMGLVLPIVTVLIFNNPFRRQKKSDEPTPEIGAPTAGSSAET